MEKRLGNREQGTAESIALLGRSAVQDEASRRPYGLTIWYTEPYMELPNDPIRKTRAEMKTNLIFRISEIAELTGGTVLGDRETTISGVASIEEAQDGDLVFAENPKYIAFALKSDAAAVIVPDAAQGQIETSKTLLFHSNPRLAFVQVLEAFVPPSAFPRGVHPTAILGEGVVLGHEVSIAAYVTIGDRTVIGDHVVVGSGVHISTDCTIGEQTVIYPNVVIYDQVTIGKRCLIHAGCVLGADGFGYMNIEQILRKVPQLGGVAISDDVEIGANSCIDRAKTGMTFVGQGTKIDNLVHIAHNCHIGASCILAAEVGIAGGTKIGDGVLLAGQVGITDHVTIGDGARIAAQSGVISNVAAGATYMGFPARPHTEKLREYAAATQLPDALKRLRDLEKRLAALEAVNG